MRMLWTTFVAILMHLSGIYGDKLFVQQEETTVTGEAADGTSVVSVDGHLLQQLCETADLGESFKRYLVEPELLMECKGSCGRIASGSIACSNFYTGNCRSYCFSCVQGKSDYSCWSV
jgi:hypothetical protein